MKSKRNIIRKLKHELIPLILKGKISEKTAKRYERLAEKILFSKKYLKNMFSKGHLRRISRVLSIIDRIVELKKESLYGSLFALKSGLFSIDMKTVFETFREFNLYMFRKKKAESFLKNFIGI